MRQRIEDLGRLAILLRSLVDNDLFERRTIRNKDYYEWFCEQTDDQKDDIIRSWVYGLDNVQEKLYEMLEIAQGTDLLNDPELFSHGKTLS